MMKPYAVRDGDTCADVARLHTIRMRDTVGYCELCVCYRDSQAWQVAHADGIPFAVCSRHTPIEIAVWEAPNANL